MTRIAHSHPPMLTNAFTAHTPSDTSNNDASINTQPLSRKKRGIAETANLWPQNSTLKISLYGLDEKTKKLIKEEASKLLPHINLKFEFTDERGGDIRVTLFKGTWSAVGTEAKTLPVDEPTLSFDRGLIDTPEDRGLIKHEFMHALGVHHEHQHPDRVLPPEVQLEYENLKQRVDALERKKEGAIKSGDKWDLKNAEKELKPLKEKLEQMTRDKINIINPDTSTLTDYDPGSITGYWPTPRTEELSDGDKELLRLLYPPNTAPSEAHTIIAPLPLATTLIRFLIEEAN